MMSHPPTRALLTSLVLLAACDPGEPPAPPAPEVLVVEVQVRDVPIVLEWLGTTEGFVDADVRAQVSGYLIARDYEEGQLVKTGRPALPHRPAHLPGRARAGARRASARRGGTPALAARRHALHTVGSRRRRQPAGVRQRRPAQARREAAVQAARRPWRRPRSISGFSGDPLADRRHRGRGPAAARRFRGPQRFRAAHERLEARPHPGGLPGERAGLPPLRVAHPGGAGARELPTRRARADPRGRHGLSATAAPATRPAATSIRARAPSP